MADHEKDHWDKLEIFAKVIGSILIPTVVAGSVYYWNTQRTELATSTKMIEIAIGILSEEAESPLEVGVTDPLREWAVSVLLSPSSPPTISLPAALALQKGRRLNPAAYDPETMRERNAETHRKVLELLKP